MAKSILPSLSQSLLLTAILLGAVCEESITYLPPHDYNYTANTIFNVTCNLADTTYHIRPGFEFLTRGKNYSECWFHTDGLLFFDSKYAKYSRKSNYTPTPCIALAGNMLLGKNLVVRTTSDNFTVDYAAKNIDGLSVHWIITYYRNSSDWVFDVHTIEN